MPHEWRLQLLGELRADGDERSIDRFPTRKTGALLAWLALHPGASQPREQLAERFWPGSAPDAGRNSLSQALSTLRRLLEPGSEPESVVVADRTSVRLADGAVATDVAAFEAAILAVEAAERGSAARRSALGEALERYTGELMPAYYDDWILLRRDELAERHRWACSELVEHLLGAGEVAEAVRRARRGIVVDPAGEAAHRDLIRALKAAGRPGEALRQFRALESVLAQELGVEPGDESRALVADLAGLAIDAGEGEPDATRDVASTGSTASTDGVAWIGATAAKPSTGSTGTTDGVAWIGATAAKPSTGSTGTTDDVAWAGTTAAAPSTGSTAAFASRGPRGLATPGGAPGSWHGIATCLVVRAPADLPPDDATRHLRALARIVQDFGARVIRAGARESIVLLRHASEGAALADQAARASAVPLSIAIHTGELPAGQPEADGTPAVVELAARLASIVRPGRIVMTQATQLLAGPAIADDDRLVPLGRFELGFDDDRIVLFEFAEPGAGAGGAPPEPPLDAAPARRSRVPRRRDRMVGRRQEREAILGLVDGGARLVTITGMGGTGKSRMASAVAGELEDRGRETVAWVELAPLSDPAEVPRAIATVLGVPAPALARPIDGLAEAIGDSRALVVLDNLEQLLPAAATTVAEILDACPGIVCLCTSRRRLGLAGEREYPLAPLPVPSVDEIEQQLRASPSVELFVDRVRALQPDYAPDAAALVDVAALCAALEGVPLAIELAAARAAVLAPRQMVERIADRLRWLADERADLGERQRSLRGAIDWSYDLLSEDQRRAFERASVFAGGWDLEAAEAVLDDPLVIDRLAELRDASLIATSVSGGTVRYGMLEMLREYGAERVAADPGAAAALAARHAAHFAEVAEAAKHALTGPDQAAWFDRLAVDHANFRAALSWCAAPGGDVSTGLRMACGLQYYWYTRGHWAEGLERLRTLLGAPAPAVDPGLRARAARVAGGLATFLDRFTDAATHLEEALAIQRELGDRNGELAVMTQLSVLARRSGDGARSLELAEACAEGYRALDGELARRGLGAVLNLIGLAHRADGQTEAARPYLEESLAIIRTLGDAKAMADVLENLAQLDLAMGRLHDAMARIVEGIDCSVAIDSKWGVLRAMTAAAMVHAAAGDPERAVRCHGAVSMLESRLDERRSGSVNAERAAAWESLRGRLGADAYERHWAAGAGLGWDEAIAEAKAPIATASG